MDTSKIFFMADTHAFHKNMVYGESTWEDKEVFCRRFNTAKEMTEVMAKNINDIVPEDGVIFFLGDWSFNGIDKIQKFREMIKCKTIIMIPGNHDNVIKKGQMHDLFQGVMDNFILDIDGVKIYMSHAPLPEIERIKIYDYENVIFIHGHLHGGKLSKMFKGVRIDVGMDTNNLKPITWDQLMEKAKAKRESLKKTF